MFKFFKKIYDKRAIAEYTRDIQIFVLNLKKSDPHQIAVVVACAAEVRNNMKDKKGIDFIDSRLLLENHPETLYLINRFIKLMQKEGRFMSACGGMVWLHSIRVFAYPDQLVTFGKSMWRELKRGFDLVEQASEEAKVNFGQGFKIEGYRNIPKGLE